MAGKPTVMGTKSVVVNFVLSSWTHVRPNTDEHSCQETPLINVGLHSFTELSDCLNYRYIT